MSKRSNPFIDDYIPQSKVYFGIKQFNNNEEGLKNVYEKTLQLLFNGAKKTIVPEPNNVMVSVCHDNKKQLFISKNGSLLHSGTMVQTRCASKKCKCGGQDVELCAYCEKPVCDKCRHYCSQCDDTYCSCCSLIRSEGVEVCVSCYK